MDPNIGYNMGNIPNNTFPSADNLGGMRDFNQFGQFNYHF